MKNKYWLNVWQWILIFILIPFAMMIGDKLITYPILRTIIGIILFGGMFVVGWIIWDEFYTPPRYK